MIVNETVLFPKVEYRIETQDEKTEKLINTKALGKTDILKIEINMESIS